MPKVLNALSHALAFVSLAALTSACTGSSVRDLGLDETSTSAASGTRTGRAPAASPRPSPAPDASPSPTPDVSPSPSVPPSPTPSPQEQVALVDTGGLHTCVINLAGEVRCFGYNGSGQLGDGTRTTGSTPKIVSGISTLAAAHGGPTQLALGSDHSCVLFQSGRVACWGSNAYGQLGSDGHTVSGSPMSLAPVLVPDFGRVTQLVAGNQFTCARVQGLYTGQLFCWGKQYGNTAKITVPVISGSGFSISVTYNTIDLGIDYPLSTSTPTRVNLPNSRSVASIAAGGTHVCALGTDQRAYCFGNNDYRQLGVSTVPYTWTPTQVPALSYVSEISGGGYHSCARISGGIVCWGMNSSYQVGTVSTQTPCSGSACELATTVDKISDARGLALGGWHSCELNASGQARCWGYNVQAQLGTSVGGASFEPVAPQGTADLVFTRLSGGGYQTCGVTNDARLVCWGNNSFGQQGQGGEYARLPAAVSIAVP